MDQTMTQPLDDSQTYECFYLPGALQDMQRGLDFTHQNIRSIRDTARTILASSALAVPLLNALRLSLVANGSQPSLLSAYILYFSSFLFIATVFLCIYILAPKGVYAALVADWDKIQALYALKTKEETDDIRLANYINAIQLNEKTIERLARVVTLAGVLLGLDIAMLLLTL